MLNTVQQPQDEELSITLTTLFTNSIKSLLTSSSHINMALCHELKNNFSANNHRQEKREQWTQFLGG
jgi:hypothetical protein